MYSHGPKIHRSHLIREEKRTKVWSIEEVEQKLLFDVNFINVTLDGWFGVVYKRVDVIVPLSDFCGMDLLFYFQHTPYFASCQPIMWKRIFSRKAGVNFVTELRSHTSLIHRETLRRVQGVRQWRLSSCQFEWSPWRPRRRWEAGLIERRW